MEEGRLVFVRLAIALAIGLIIGIERGWHRRDREEGRRVAGLRTYGLIGLLGGSSAILAEHIGPVVIAFAFAALAALMIAAYTLRARNGEDIGITSLVAALLTFVLGALAVAGHVSLAAASAVVATLLLNYKSRLHDWISALEARELGAGLQLLLISVVALPLLPNRNFGPWEALNPYAIWWMVVLIAIISFVGYFAVKIGGMRKGILFTSLSGGLASSTAITLHLSRMARKDPAMVPLLATGTLVACGTMLPRILLVAGLLNPALLPLAAPALGTMAVLVYAPALFYWRSQKALDVQVDARLRNPLELRAAIAFGALLALILMLGRALQEWFGDTGIIALALASGITDVDAITLSLARMSGDSVALQLAVVGIVVAAAVNSAAKAGMATAIGGRRMGLRVGVPLVAAAAAGLFVAWLSV